VAKSSTSIAYIVLNWTVTILANLESYKNNRRELKINHLWIHPRRRFMKVILDGYPERVSTVSDSDSALRVAIAAAKDCVLRPIPDELQRITLDPSAMWVGDRRNTGEKFGRGSCLVFCEPERPHASLHRFQQTDAISQPANKKPQYTNWHSQA
jgi:hypothetical protein